MKTLPRPARLAFCALVLLAAALLLLRGWAVSQNGAAPVFENRADLPVQSLTIDLLRDRQVMGSTTVQYADNTPMEAGDRLSLDLSDLPAGDADCRFRLCANTAAGPVYGPVLSLSRWDEGLRAALVHREDGLGLLLWTE